jgi:hypothetical protein
MRQKSKSHRCSNDHNIILFTIGSKIRIHSLALLIDFELSEFGMSFKTPETTTCSQRNIICEWETNILMVICDRFSMDGIYHFFVEIEMASKRGCQRPRESRSVGWSASGRRRNCPSGGRKAEAGESPRGRAVVRGVGVVRQDGKPQCGSRPQFGRGK